MDEARFEKEKKILYAKHGKSVGLNCGLVAHFQLLMVSFQPNRRKYALYIYASFA